MNLKAIMTGTNTFETESAEDFKKSLKLKPGDFIQIETWKPRSMEYHRKYFSMINTVLYFLPEGEQYDRFRNIDYLRKELQIMCGEVDIHITMDGEQQLIPKSISFKSMEAEEFDRLYRLSLDAALKYLLHDLTEEQFEKNLLGYL